MLCLLNDLLDSAQLKNDKFKLVIVEFDIIKLLKETIEMMRFLARAKQIKIEFKQENIISPQSLQFRSDPNRLFQILINLLSNAIKFTPKNGNIILSIKQIYKSTKISRKMEISVQDSGVGINKADQQQLFKNFSKIISNQNQIMNPQGVGLGLAISAQLAKALLMKENSAKPLTQPPIRVESDPNSCQGSKFSFLIRNQKKSQDDLKHSTSFQKEIHSVMDPDEEVMEEKNQIRDKMPANYRMNKMTDLNQSINNTKLKFLLVDDTAFNIDILEEHLNSLGYNCKSFCDLFQRSTARIPATSV